MSRNPQVHDREVWSWMRRSSSRTDFKFEPSRSRTDHPFLTSSSLLQTRDWTFAWKLPELSRTIRSLRSLGSSRRSLGAWRPPVLNHSWRFKQTHLFKQIFITKQCFFWLYVHQTWKFSNCVNGKVQDTLALLHEGVQLLVQLVLVGGRSLLGSCSPLDPPSSSPGRSSTSSLGSSSSSSATNVSPSGRGSATTPCSATTAATSNPATTTSFSDPPGDWPVAHDTVGPRARRLHHGGCVGGHLDLHGSAVQGDSVVLLQSWNIDNQS